MFHLIVCKNIYAYCCWEEKKNTICFKPSAVRSVLYNSVHSDRQDNDQSIFITIKIP